MNSHQLIKDKTVCPISGQLVDRISVQVNRQW